MAHGNTIHPQSDSWKKSVGMQNRTRKTKQTRLALQDIRKLKFSLEYNPEKQAITYMLNLNRDFLLE